MFITPVTLSTYPLSQPQNVVLLRVSRGHVPTARHLHQITTHRTQDHTYISTQPTPFLLLRFSALGWRKAGGYYYTQGPEHCVYTMPPVQQGAIRSSCGSSGHLSSRSHSVRLPSSITALLRITEGSTQDIFNIYNEDTTPRSAHSGQSLK
jgi:hypothetical protein